MRTPVAIVLANYNQEQHLERCVLEVERTFAGTPFDLEWALVDDHSRDRTRAISEALSRGRNMRLVNHEVNLGRGRSVADGIRAARAPWVATLDTDLEVAPAYLLALLQALEAGADVALARRFYPAPLSPGRVWELWRWSAHRGYRALVRAALGTRLDTASGCRAFRREAILPVLSQTQDPRWFWDTEVIVRAVAAGLRLAEIDAHCPGKAAGGTTFSVIPEALAHLRYVVALRRRLAREARAAAVDRARA